MQKLIIHIVNTDRINYKIYDDGLNESVIVSYGRGELKVIKMFIMLD